MLGMKASLRGARLIDLPSTSGCLGAFALRPSLGRHTSGGSARLLVATQDIWVSLHSIRLRPTDFWLHHQLTPDIANFSYDIIGDFFIRRTFQDLAGYPQILGVVV
jgi:hypothetical protein